MRVLRRPGAAPFPSGGWCPVLMLHFIVSTAALTFYTPPTQPRTCHGARAVGVAMMTSVDDAFGHWFNQLKRHDVNLIAQPYMTVQLTFQGVSKAVTLPPTSTTELLLEEAERVHHLPKDTVRLIVKGSPVPMGRELGRSLFADPTNRQVLVVDKRRVTLMPASDVSEGAGVASYVDDDVEITMRDIALRCGNDASSSAEVTQLRAALHALRAERAAERAEARLLVRQLAEARQELESTRRELEEAREQLRAFAAAKQAPPSQPTQMAKQTSRGAASPRGETAEEVVGRVNAMMAAFEARAEALEAEEQASRAASTGARTSDNVAAAGESAADVVARAQDMLQAHGQR